MPLKGCFPEDTLILTKKGYKQITKINGNDILLNYNINTHRLEYVKISGKYISEYTKNMIEFNTRLLLPPYLEMYYFDNKEIKKCLALEAFYNKNIYVPICNKYNEIQKAFIGNIYQKPYKGKLYNVKVNNNNLIIRRNNFTIITGNTLYL